MPMLRYVSHCVTATLSFFEKRFRLLCIATQSGSCICDATGNAFAWWLHDDNLTLCKSWFCAIDGCKLKVITRVRFPNFYLLA